MPRAATHLVAGVVTAGVVNVVIQWNAKTDDPNYRFDWGEFLVCCGAGGAAGLLPDILEPADTPNHRAFFHSLAAAALVAWAMSGKHTKDCAPGSKKLLLSMGFAYLSHLVLDAQTPKSIPIV